jgi:hypothetical protein
MAAQIAPGRILHPPRQIDVIGEMATGPILPIFGTMFGCRKSAVSQHRPREKARRGLEQRAPPVGCARAVSATRSRPRRWIVLEDRQKRTRKAEARLFKIAHRRQRLGMDDDDEDAEPRWLFPLTKAGGGL